MAIESETTKNIQDNCIKCGKSLEGLKRRSARKFCSPLCRTRYFALKRYHEIKGTDDYKQKRRVYERKWRAEHKEEWNARMRTAAAKYRAKKKKIQLNDGLTGQQTGETMVSEGDDTTKQVEGHDQPSQPKQDYEEMYK